MEVESIVLRIIDHILSRGIILRAKLVAIHNDVLWSIWWYFFILVVFSYRQIKIIAGVVARLHFWDALEVFATITAD